MVSVTKSERTNQSSFILAHTVNIMQPEFVSIVIVYN